jgi:hypothetical protein
MDDHVDLGILDSTDPARKRRIVPPEVLEERGKGVGPRVLALVDSEDHVTVAK